MSTVCARSLSAHQDAQAAGAQALRLWRPLRLVWRALGRAAQGEALPRTEGHVHDRCSRLSLAGARPLLCHAPRDCISALTQVKNEERTLLLKLQAAKTSKEYLKLLDRDMDAQKIATELTDITEQNRKLLLELEIVKKQAGQTAEEYFQLTDRYSILEKKLGSPTDKKRD